MSEATAKAAGATGGQEPPSILILTKDEEVNIAACLETVSFSDDIVVLDSFSSDKTLEIAAKFPNVRIIQRKFDTWSRHSNWALENIQFKHPWVYYSDADERLTPELRDEILGRINDPSETAVAYRLAYKNMFMGRWLKHGGIFPVWIIRLYRPDKIRYEDREVNAHPIVQGTLGDLRECFIHYSFNKGLLPWFHKHNSYSNMESNEAVRIIKDESAWDKIRQMTSKQPGVARRALKDLSFFMPLRGPLRFLYMYFLKLGILDGRAGFHYASMISMYEYWIEVKIREHRSRWREKTEEVVRRLLSRGEPAGGSRASSPALPDGSPLVEVMIPTYNEAAHIKEAVENARQLGPVFVLDSFSTDGTQELARAAGATVVEHKFENYSRQKNWGLDNLGFKGKWIFILDADERVTPELRDEVQRVCAAGDKVAGYFVNRVVLFMGREIRHGGLFPSWNLRLFRRGMCRYEDRSVHEHMLCDGETGYTRNLMLHIRRETLSQYITKHIKYADMESEEWVRSKTGSGGGASASHLFRDTLRVRQWVRRVIWPRLPMKPLIRFVYMYFARAGFMDGRAGWHLACLMASYEYMISLLDRDKRERLKSGGATR